MYCKANLPAFGTIFLALVAAGMFLAECALFHFPLCDGNRCCDPWQFWFTVRARRDCGAFVAAIVLLDLTRA